MNTLDFDKGWEKIFISNRSFASRLVIALCIACAGFCLTYTIFSITHIYFSSLIICIVIVLSLFSGFSIAFPMAIILGLLSDYFLLAPVGRLFDSPLGYEHFFIITGISFFTSYLISKLRIMMIKMHQSQEEAEAAAKAMEKILAMVSHDIRNPLSVTKLSLQVFLRNPGSNEKSLTVLSKALKSIDYTNSLIQTLLDVSRIRSGKNIPMEFSVCDLTTSLKKIIEDISENICDRILYQGPLEEIDGSWSLLGIRRAIENLVTNAVKYGDASTPINIKAYRENETVFISVHNRGKVIPEAEQKKLFESFHRSSEAEAGRISGWGLGLSLVKAVAEGHQGEVSVNSTSEKGTIFTLKLPIIKGAV